MIHKVQDAKSRKIHYRIMMVFVLIVHLFIYLFIIYLCLQKVKWVYVLYLCVYLYVCTHVDMYGEGKVDAGIHS